jgi:hypothetical protein
MTAIYLAAAYGRRDEMVITAERLIAAGHTITSRWIYGDHEVPPAGIAVDSPEHLAWAAVEDIRHVEEAACIVSVTGGETRARGGRHAEFGMGVGLGKRLILLGDREHVFHFLPQVEQVGGVDALLAQLVVLR